MIQKVIPVFAAFCALAAATNINAQNAGEVTIESLGVGTENLIGGDLTDPENDGNEAAGALDPSWNWAGVTASHEPEFQGAEAAFNIFDNRVGAGNDKWCCDDPIEDMPVWVAVQFLADVSLTHFTVTSGNDSPDRDPTDWAIQGSNDGVNYTDIYHSTADPAPWVERNEVLRFTLPAPSAPYRYIRYIAYNTPGTLHQINEVEYFGTIASLDRIFLSAINPRGNLFTFRATDVGASVVDPASVRLSIDNQAVTPVTSVKTGNATDFTYVPTPPFAAGSTHEYLIELNDLAGNTVTNSGSFTVPIPFFPPADILGTNVLADAWKIRWIFGAGTIGSGAVAMSNLVASAQADFEGIVVDTTNNVIDFGTGGLFANALPIPDELVNDPSGAWTGDNYVFYAFGNIEIAESGEYTFGVHSDDGFALRIRGGELLSVTGNGQADPGDPEAVIHPGTTGDSSTRGVYRLNAGVYRVEFMFYEAGGGDFVELYAAKGSFSADGDTTTWKLVGDPEPSREFTYLGVTDAGWTVVSSDPGGDPLNTWADALADLEATGGASTNIASANIGDPDTNAGVLPFPKDAAGDQDDFAIRANGTLVVPTAGTYEIGFNSDDGAYVTIDGGTFTEVISNATGLSVIQDGETVICDCLTGASLTTATITLPAGDFPIEAAFFDRGGGAFLRVWAAEVGAENPPALSAGGGGTYRTAEAVQLTDKPAGGGGPDGDLQVSVTRSGNNLVIQWTPAGGTLETSGSLGPTATWTAVGSDNPATIQIGTGNAFYRVRQ
ncbi:MAG: PA14 domain-containing protein [Verrucomicrobiia bacterium]